MPTFWALIVWGGRGLSWGRKKEKKGGVMCPNNPQKINGKGNEQQKTSSSTAGLQEKEKRRLLLLWQRTVRKNIGACSNEGKLEEQRSDLERMERATHTGGGGGKKRFKKKWASAKQKQQTLGDERGKGSCSVHGKGE